MTRAYFFATAGSTCNALRSPSSFFSNAKSSSSLDAATLLDSTCHQNAAQFVLLMSRKALVSVYSTILANERVSWVLETSVTLETLPPCALSRCLLKTTVLLTCVKAHHVFQCFLHFPSLYDTHYNGIFEDVDPIFSRRIMRIKRFLSSRENVVLVIKTSHSDKSASGKRSARGATPFPVAALSNPSTPRYDEWPCQHACPNIE
ncbi:hypothetical protein PsorP6_000715 [Peronosclerospora sorghi]|uniref:Uncharacterized protein n=1 Tax=Peronosclerospora sorghi TaxID=230839 RepID=A0ACC0WTK5_9STRA|nr:hypothetical protein PsorP6_000715 [Peronosclerospora sorghi]